MATSSEELSRLLNLNRNDSSALSEEISHFFTDRDHLDESSTSDEYQSDGKLIILRCKHAFYRSKSRHDQSFVLRDVRKALTTSLPQSNTSFAYEAQRSRSRCTK